MFDKVGGIESGVQGASRATAHLSARAEPAEASVAEISNPPLSPRMKADPAAGVIIMEYLSDKGEAEMQVPSQTVVAYLRSGLTAAGLPDKEAAAPEQASTEA